MPAHGAGASGPHASSQRASGHRNGIRDAAMPTHQDADSASLVSLRTTRRGTVGRPANRLDPRTSAFAFDQRGMPISAFAEATADLAEACGGGGHSPRF